METYIVIGYRDSNTIASLSALRYLNRHIVQLTDSLKTS